MNVNLTNNVASDEYVSVDIEASPAEEDQPAGLSIDVDDNQGKEVSIWETDPSAIREFRDAVVAECDRALELLA